MLKPDRIPSSEITPPNVYFNRRTFLRAGAAAGQCGGDRGRLPAAEPGRVDGGRNTALSGLPVVATTPEDSARGFRVDEPMTPLEQRRQLQQLLRVHDRQGRGRGRGGRVRVAAVDGGRRGDGPQAEGVRPGRGAPARPAGRAGVPDAVRRGVVDGHPVGRASAGPASRPGGADGQAEVRRVPDLARPRPLAGPEGVGAPLALRRRPADGRGDASAHAPGGRPLRPRAAGPERRPAAAGGALEVRVQGDQVDRQDHPRVGPAADDVERRMLRPSTGSSRTSTRPSPTRAGARRPSSGSGSQAAGRRSCSTATPSRSATCTRAWTCGSTSKSAARAFPMVCSYSRDPSEGRMERARQHL